MGARTTSKVDLGPVWCCCQGLVWQGSSSSLLTAKCSFLLTGSWAGTLPAHQVPSATSQGPATTAATSRAVQYLHHRIIFVDRGL